VRLKSLPLIALCALALAGNLAGASAHSSAHSSHRPSSYAPRTHSGSHVYGSPISHPLVSRSSSRHSSGHSSSHHPRTSHASSERAAGVTRDRHGRIERSGKAKDEFRRKHPCPSTGKTSGACKGYVIDHVQALKHGGADDPSNMQWQTKEAAKEKDKVE
jgi:hypothetical protein